MRISATAPGLTPREIRRKRFPRTYPDRESVKAREARLTEILQIIKTGYSRRSAISLELREEISQEMLGRDLAELENRGKVQLINRCYWVPK